MLTLPREMEQGDGGGGLKWKLQGVTACERESSVTRRQQTKRCKT
jgi:hypothetical protein